MSIKIFGVVLTKCSIIIHSVNEHGKVAFKKAINRRALLND